jgi:hypothetical protein
MLVGTGKDKYFQNIEKKILDVDKNYTTFVDIIKGMLVLEPEDRLTLKKIIGTLNEMLEEFNKNEKKE